MDTPDSPVLTAALLLGVALVGGSVLVIVLSVLLAVVGVAVGLLWALVGALLEALPFVVAAALVWYGYQHLSDDDATAVAGAGRSEADRRTAPDGGADPAETLRRRYVDGELSEAEFERRMDRLMGSRRDAGSATERRRELLDED